MHPRHTHGIVIASISLCLSGSLFAQGGGEIHGNFSMDGQLYSDDEQIGAVKPPADLGKSNDLLGNWDQSKAVKSGKECQTCHMPEQVGESANGEAKRKVANHTFPGRIGQLRQEAAKLEVSTKVEGEKTTVTVAVQSLVPHNLPTTHPGWASASG